MEVTIAETYEEEVSIAIDGLGEALQPILTIILGIIVGLVILWVGIPLISMIEQLNGLDGALLQIGQTLSVPDAANS